MKLKVFRPNDSLDDAVDAVKIDGIVGIEGTKTMVEPFLSPFRRTAAAQIGY